MTSKIPIPTRFSRSSLVDGYDHGKFSRLRVVIVGCGALGNYVALGISGFGVREIVLVDNDTIDESNLNRQLVYTNGDINKSKALALKERLDERVVVDLTTVTAMSTQLSPDNMAFVIEDANGKQADVIFLCVDNVQTRLEVNDYCIAHGIPFINGGTSKGTSGEYCTIIPGKTACLRCFMKPATDRERCSEQKDPSIVGTSMLISSLMLVEFQNLFIGKKTTPPVMKFESGRCSSKEIVVDELFSKPSRQSSEKKPDPAPSPEPFYHAPMDPVKTCTCQKKR